MTKSVFAQLPNDLIIKILRFRKEQKQKDRFIKNKMYNINEIIRIDRLTWGNVLKNYYEGRVSHGNRYLTTIKAEAEWNKLCMSDDY